MNITKRAFSLLHKTLKNTSRNKIITSKSGYATASIVCKPDEEKSIVTEKINFITTIGINRPHKKNSLDASTAQYLSEALDDFENDETSKIAIIHGIGGTFCAGFDLHEIATYNGECEDHMPHFGPLCNRCDVPFKKPLIGSISGYAVGAGFELALMCDLRIVEETTIMGVFNRRFGIPMMLGGTVRLPAIIGYARAMDLILRGRPIEAKEAVAWGLATEIVPCGAALGQSLMLARTLMKYPVNAILADRMSAHQATFSGEKVEDSLQFEKDNAAHLLYEEGVEGAQHFVNGIGRHGKFPMINPPDKSLRELDDNVL